MLIALILAIAPTAIAATLDPALAESVIVQNEIDLRALKAKQAALEAELAARKAADATCPVATPCHAPIAPAPKPKTTSSKTKAVPVPAPIVPDPKIAILEQAIADLKTQIAAFPAPTPAYDDTAIRQDIASKVNGEDFTAATDRLAVVEGKVTALENAPAPQPLVEVHNTNTETYVSNFHPSAYSFVTANFAAPYPGHEGIVGGRFDVGARFLWETPKNLNLGIAIEGGPSTFIGWGVRGGPELTTDVGFGDVSLTAGVGYDCTDLGGLGCEAQHTGGFANVGWEYGDSGVLSFGIRAGMQLAWVTTTAAPEGFYDLNGIVGVGGYFGNLHAQGY